MASFGMSRGMEAFDEKVRAYREAQARASGARDVQYALDQTIADIHRYHGDQRLLPGLEEAHRLARRKADELSREAIVAYERALGRAL